MKKNLFQTVIALTVLGFTGIAHAQYGYTVGTAPGGGNTIVGSGSLDALNTAPPLSLTGGDSITISLGATALSTTGQDTIRLSTGNNTLVILGNVQGAVGFNAGDNGFNAISGTASFQSIANSGTIAGGAGASDTGYHHIGGNGGDGISFFGFPSLTNISIGNTSLIMGGQGGDGGGGSGYAGQGGNAIDLEADTIVSGVVIHNGGSLLGGDGGADTHYQGLGGYGGIAVFFEASTLQNISIVNSGIIAGGNAQGDSGYMRTGGGGASAIQSDSGTLANFSITNLAGGSITGGNGGDSGRYENAGDGGSAIYLSAQAANGNSLINYGSIAGGNGGDGQNSHSYNGGEGGNAFDLSTHSGDITGFSLTNSGIMTGGNGGIGGYDDGAGSAGNAAYFSTDSGGNIVNLTVNNTGSLIGGAGGSDIQTYGSGAEGGNGLYVEASSTLANFTLNNAGTILGGKGGDNGYQEYGAYGGAAVYVEADTIVNSTFTNSGTITGGAGGGLTSYVNNTYYGGYGGEGIYIDADDYTNSTIVNNGLIVGGASGTTPANSYWPGQGGNGIHFDVDTITNGALVNSGTILGGAGREVDAGTEYGGYGGYGVEVGVDSINGMTIINNPTGLIKGGAGGNGGYYEADGQYGVYISADNSINGLVFKNAGTVVGGEGAATGGNGGYGLYVGSGTITNSYILNTGTIAGGAGHNGFEGGQALYLEADASNDSLIVDNHGLIRGGSTDSGGTPGYGVTLYTNYTILNNWGTISSGAGDAGTAIYVDGTANVINLYGHSVTSGMIEVHGPSNSNVLNIKLSGINPAIAASISQQLAAQGITPGVDSSGTLVIRGTTIQWDPVVVNIQTTSYTQQGVTPNQKAIGIALDSAIVNPTGGTLALMNAIDQSGNVPFALGQLSPQMYQIFGDIAWAGAKFNSLQIDQRLNNLRDGSESIDTSALGGETTAGFSKDGKDSKGLISTQSNEKHWGFFASGDAIHSDIDARDGLSDQRFTTAGLVLGLDGKVNENWVVGTLFSYQYTSAEMDNLGSKANVDSFGGGLYAGYHNGGWYGNGLATYTRNNYETTRVIAFPGFNNAAFGNTNSNLFAINIDGGYDFNLGSLWTAGPIAGLQYGHLGVDSFNEAGTSGANLAVNDQDLDSLRSRLGFRLAYHKQIGKEAALGVEARAEWQHEFLDDSRGIGATFVGAGLAPFSVATSKPERDAALLGLGVNLTVRDRVTFFGDYDVQTGQKSYFEQSIRGGIKLSW